MIQMARNSNWIDPGHNKPFPPERANSNPNRLSNRPTRTCHYRWNGQRFLKSATAGQIGTLGCAISQLEWPHTISAIGFTSLAIYSNHLRIPSERAISPRLYLIEDKFTL